MCFDDDLYFKAIMAGITLPFFMFVVLRLAPVGGDLKKLAHICETDSAKSGDGAAGKASAFHPAAAL